MSAQAESGGKVEWGRDSAGTLPERERCQPLSKHPATRTLWLPGLALAVLVVVTVQVVRGDGIVAADLHVKMWAAHHQVRGVTTAADRLTKVISPTVDIVVLLGYAAWRARDRLHIAVWAASALAVVVLTMKATIGRMGPTGDAHFFGAYPSGHTACVVVCTGTMTLLSDLSRGRAAQAWAASITLSLLVIASLLYLQDHWLSDVIGSVAFAVIVLWAVALTRPAIDPRSPS